jgi:hypothetical protein
LFRRRLSQSQTFNFGLTLASVHQKWGGGTQIKVNLLDFNQIKVSVRINQRESFCLAGEKWQGGERIVRMVDK